MKRKYYMRGLGIGILVTAIICAVAMPKKTEPMTDAQVIARAKELGYEKKVSGVTADDIDKIKENNEASGTPGVSGEPEGSQDITAEPEGTPGPTTSPVPTPEAPEPPEEPDQPEKPATPTPKPTSTPVPKPTATATPKPAATTAPTKAPTEGEEPAVTSYTITVERGATARRVAERLASTGAIADADGFVRYLQSNGLTDYINIGTFTIPKGASHAEIAKILTGR